MDAAISIEAPRTRETGLTAEYLRSRVMLEAETQRFIWLLHPGSANGNTFGTIEEASAAYRKVAAEMHGEFLHESQKYYKDQ